MDIRRAQVEAVLDASEEVEAERVEVVSPSGRYRMVVRTYHRDPDVDLTRGTVYRVDDGTIVCDLKRNYRAFHASFVSRGGTEYLITGRSFTSQTIVDLGTGEEREGPGDQYNIEAFCWAHAELSPDGTTLAVDGCYLGKPYEYRFYDFTDPMRGWPALPLIGVEHVEAVDGQLPQWVGPATYEAYMPRPTTKGGLEIAVRTRVQRDGDRMVLIERAEADDHAALDAAWHSFVTSDPMFLAMQEAIRAHALPATGGIPGEKKVVRFFRRASPPASADLIWDLDTDITVRTFTETGERRDETAYPHTVAGIVAAIDAIAAEFKTS